MRAFVVGVVLGLSGCSFAIVDRPPSAVPPHGPVSCDSSAAIPNIVDLALGTAAGLMVFAIYYSASIDESRPASERPATSVALPVLFGSVAAAPWYASAYIGYRRARQCRDLKRRR